MHLLYCVLNISAPEINISWFCSKLFFVVSFFRNETLSWWKSNFGVIALQHYSVCIVTQSVNIHKRLLCGQSPPQRLNVLSRGGGKTGGVLQRNTSATMWLVIEGGDTAVLTFHAAAQNHTEIKLAFAECRSCLHVDCVAALCCTVFIFFYFSFSYVS